MVARIQKITYFLRQIIMSSDARSLRVRGAYENLGDTACSTGIRLLNEPPNETSTVQILTLYYPNI